MLLISHFFAWYNTHTSAHTRGWSPRGTTTLTRPRVKISIRQWVAEIPQSQKFSRRPTVHGESNPQEVVALPAREGWWMKKVSPQTPICIFVKLPPENETYRPHKELYRFLLIQVEVLCHKIPKRTAKVHTVLMPNLYWADVGLSPWTLMVFFVAHPHYPKQFLGASLSARTSYTHTMAPKESPIYTGTPSQKIVSPIFMTKSILSQGNHVVAKLNGDTHNHSVLRCTLHLAYSKTFNHFFFFFIEQAP